MNVKKKPLTLSRDTVSNLGVRTSVRTGIVLPPANTRVDCPAHTLGNYCPRPGTTSCPM